MEKGSVSVDYERKRREYAQQTGDIRKGIGMAAFWYNTGVWPISLETSSCRMVMNQDGSIQVQVGEDGDWTGRRYCICADGGRDTGDSV